MVATETPLPPVHVPALDAPPAPPPRTARSLVWAVAAVIAGIALLCVALLVIDTSATLLKIATAVVGAFLLFRGLSGIGKHIWGSTFDLGFWLSATWLTLLVLSAIFADVLPVGEHLDTSKTVSIPGNQRPDLFSDSPLGTNTFALDLLARCIFGARATLLTVLVAIGVSLVIGTAIGIIAGYSRGWLDSVIGVVVDGMMAVPSLVLLIAFAAVLGTPTGVAESVVKTGLALAIVGVPTMARLARANTLTVAQREFVLAGQSLGARTPRILRREILPNVMLPMLSFAFIWIAVLIIAEGSLSFLGLGLQPPHPTWGNMIAEGGSETLRRHPHIVLVPGAFMFITVFAFNRVGEFARRAWDPRESAI